MPDPQQKRGRGCLFYLLIAAAVSVVMLAFGAFFGYRYSKWLIAHYTDAQPAPLPTVQLSEIQMFQLHDKVDTFRDDVRDGDRTPPLELTADELNALIETDPGFTALKNHLFVTITNNQLSAQISFPAEDLGLGKLRGRYVNATGTFHVGLVTNELQITAESLSVRGEPIPRHIMREVASENFGDKFNQNPRAAAALERLKSIEVKDGKLVVVPRR